MKTKLNERLAESGGRNRNPQIASEREIEPRAGSGAVNRSDHWLGHLSNRQDYTARRTEQTREFLSVVALHKLGHEMHVAAGAKDPSSAGDYYDADMGIAAGFFQSLSKIAPHVTNKSVEPIRPIKRDGYDAVILGNFD